MFAYENGKRIAGAIIDEDSNRDPEIHSNGYGRIHLVGYDGSYIGRMATLNGEYSVMTNEEDSNVWLFKTGDCGNHQDLDRRKVNNRNDAFQLGADDDETSPYFHAGRKMATGMIHFPEFGGNKPKRK